ncbi:O-antigen translocase (plasmid) [Gemmobacter aquarius]|uniref:O-antigen translocase n=1 Tax=Paragemmobacter aquarius TaxID=2169400 RepID=A0A2S0URU1_9RHOB|nr:O-antigen translocase [Gemmobacter aquarius]AWB50500.1 O-antigen translocase [Gemmobacter aquarius]
MTEQNSYRSILRSSAIIGAAQIIGVAGGLLRMKAVAVLTGPSGVGLVGLYTSLIQAAAVAAALGSESAGTRQIAASHAEGGEEALGRARRALFWGTLGLALIGLAGFFLAAGWIAEAVVGDPAQATPLRWLSLGVAISVAAGYQTALLTGTRRIADIARIGIGASFLGSLLACGALWMWQQDAILAVVLLPPAVTLLLGCIVIGRIGPAAGRPLGLRALAGEWQGLARLGLAFMLTGVISLLGHLLVRVYVQRELGTEALGHFQAAWTVSSTCLGLVLGAMGTDYFPRLSAVITDRARAVQMVNEQTEVGLLLCAPLLLALLGFAPWVIALLYSAEFAPATDILRFQLLGDLLKVLSWPLGFVIVARGAGSTFVVTESVGMALLIGMVVVGIPLIGLEATGVAFLVTNALYLPLVWWFGGRPIGFRWSRSVKLQAVALVGVAVLVDLCSRYSAPIGAVTGGMAALVFGGLAVIRLSHRVTEGGTVGKVGSVSRTIALWMTR